MDYTEALFLAVGILIDKRIESIKFDLTINAVITDASRAGEGIYRVSTGSATFTAYSTETEYRNNDAVMVTIPQGNYDNLKIIIGKLADADNSPLVYRSPFLTLVNVSNNVIDAYREVAFWANNPNPILGHPWDEHILEFLDSSTYKATNYSANQIELWHSDDNFFQQGYTVMGVLAQFSTWLLEYGTTFGNYGLAIELTFKCLDLPDTESNTFIKIITFDSNEFFGNVYNFETFYRQENVYDISEYINFPIVKIRLFAYQRNNFKDAQGNYIYGNVEEFAIANILNSLPENGVISVDTHNLLIAYNSNWTDNFVVSADGYLLRSGITISDMTVSDNTFSTINPNIFIKDPYICFGVPYEEFSEDTASIMTNASLTYYKGRGSLTLIPALIELRYLDNYKWVGLRWIHKDTATGIIKAIEPGEVPEGYSIRWYRFKLGAQSADEFAGAHWTRYYGSRLLPDAQEEWGISDTYEIAYTYNPDYDTDDITLYRRSPSENDYFKNGLSTFPDSDIIVQLHYDTNCFFHNVIENTYHLCSIEFRIADEDNEVDRFILTAPNMATTILTVDDHSFLDTNLLCYKLPNGSFLPITSDLYHSYFIDRGYLQVMYDKEHLGFPTETGTYITLYLPLDYVDTATNQVEVGFLPNINNLTELLKVVIVKMEANGIYRLIAASNILTFTNNDQVGNRATIIDDNALAIRYEDEELGNYFLYNRAGRVSHEADNERRTLTAIFDENVANNDKPELTPPWSYIKWEFPHDNTMIIPATSADENAVPNANITLFYDTTKVSYYIKPNLNRNATNNTVKLSIEKDGIVYHAQVQMLFGTAGTSGSDYTLFLTWENGQNAINLSVNDGDGRPEYDFDHSLTGAVYLMDLSGLMIDIPSESTITASWKVAVGPTSTMLKVQKSILYPVYFDHENALLPYPYSQLAEYAAYLHIPIADYPDTPYYYDIETAPDPDTTYYKYNPLSEFPWIEVSGAELINENNYWLLPIYRRGEKNELLFKEVPIDAEEYDSGTKLFVCYNDYYILDPWNDGYKEVETYYIPVEKSASLLIYEDGINISYKDLNNNPVSAGVEARKIVLTAGVNVSIDSLFVLEVRLGNFGNYDLVAYYPIPLKKGETHLPDSEALYNSYSQRLEKSKLFIVSFIEGPTDVRYATSGEVDYNKNPYILTAKRYAIGDGELESIKFVSSDTNTGLTGTPIARGGYWRLFYPDTWDGQVFYTPKLIETNRSEGYINDKYKAPILEPLAIYYEDAMPYGVLFCTWTGDALWTQPIVVYLDNYPSTTLNRWNGTDILTDNDTGTITANGFAAGKKESDNTFTGVVLGDWHRTDTDKAITQLTGVFGFHHGAMSYALKDDGTAFLGKAGRGRIYLSGKKSLLYSQDWLTKGNGLFLDLDDGILKINKTDSYKRINDMTADKFTSLKAQHLLFVENVAVNGENNRDFSLIPTFLTDDDCSTITTSNVYTWARSNPRFWYLGCEQVISDGTVSQSVSGLPHDNMTDIVHIQQNEQTGADEPVNQLNDITGAATLGIQSSYVVDQSSAELKKVRLYINSSTNLLAIDNQPAGFTQMGSSQYYILLYEKKIYSYRSASFFDVGGNGVNGGLCRKWSYTYEHKKIFYIYLPEIVAGLTIPLAAVNPWHLAGTSEVIKFFYKVGYKSASSVSIDTLNPAENGENPFAFNSAVGELYRHIDSESTFNKKEVYYSTASTVGSKYITLSTAESTYPFSIGSTSNVFSRKFKVNWDGQLYAEDGYFKGTINSSAGNIGGWEITDTALQAQNGSIIFDSSQGLLSGATIKTQSGEIGGWIIKSDCLEKNDTRLDSNAGIFTDSIRIRRTGAPYNSYFGGMGYVPTGLAVIDDNGNDNGEEGIGLYYGTSANTSDTIIKINSKNLGLRWNGAFMSISDSTTTPGNKVWTFSHSGGGMIDVFQAVNINQSRTTANRIDLIAPSSLGVDTTASYFAQNSDALGVRIMANHIEFLTPGPEYQHGIYARFA